MYLDLVRAVTPLLLLLMTEECVETIFVNLDILHVPCLKMILSKALGYAIVGGNLLLSSRMFGTSLFYVRIHDT